MATAPRTRAGRTGLLLVTLALLATAAALDLSRDDSLLRGVFREDPQDTPAENLVRGVRGGLARPSR